MRFLSKVTSKISSSVVENITRIVQIVILFVQDVILIIQDIIWVVQNVVGIIGIVRIIRVVGIPILRRELRLVSSGSQEAFKLVEC